MDGSSVMQFGGWEQIFGPNLGYVVELFERYQQDPDSVDQDTQAFFRTWGPVPETRQVEVSSGTVGQGMQNLASVIRALQFVHNIREYGHLEAQINPLEPVRNKSPRLDAASYGLSQQDLSTLPAQLIWPDAPSHVRTAQDVVDYLRTIYTGTLAFEFGHVHDPEERAWLTQKIESGAVAASQQPEKRKALLQRLIEVDEFEKFLHRTFVGQKRFSIEGVDVLVPMLDELVFHAVETGARHVLIGMAHRGRLNVLAHVLKKPYAAVFSEFHTSVNKELVPSEGSMGINAGWTGDVKYHLGASSTLGEDNVVQARVTLANNPSHLEFVDPVVEGFTRAAQDDRTKPGAPVTDVNSAVAVLVHGDAAFPGEGVVAETLNLSRLGGYQTGGTVHIIANNRIGFTAISSEGRSTRYASDLAKGYEIPIIHVNGDDADACLAAIQVAHEYRNQFHKDFVIDVIGYRRWGHNEADDPAMTQPQMYDLIGKHPSVRVLYSERLVEQGVVSKEDVEQMEADVDAQLAKAYEETTSGAVSTTVPELPQADNTCDYRTAVPADRLQSVNDALLVYPESFHVYPKLGRILQRRKKALEPDGKVDWGHAETLAFATILEDGTPIRLTGQDSERATFGQRHLVLHDVETGEKYCTLHGVPTAKASFDIHNSPLSETAVMGFEYGYSVLAPNALVVWEAQFGDFANVAQTLIDQFISAGRAKWAEQSGLVLLLPHGYEGQGPEHSSARLERYLQLSAEENWRVVNVSSSAQYFHLLRIQAQSLKKSPRPLVVMTPKSLLRNPHAASSISDLSEGAFQPLLADPLTRDHGKRVKRLVLCSGKVAIDLTTAIGQLEAAPEWLAIQRVEQLYPFPSEELEAVLQQYPNLEEIVWVQEEPQNMGAWSFVQPRIASVAPSVPLRYVGRPERSSPAEGFAEAHQAMQGWIVNEAITASNWVQTAGRKSK